MRSVMIIVGLVILAGVLAKCAVQDYQRRSDPFVSRCDDMNGNFEYRRNQMVCNVNGKYVELE